MTVRMEKARKTRNRFPSPSHRALGNRCSDSHIPTAPVAVSLFSKPKRKEPLATDLHLFRSGSFFDEKMLWRDDFNAIRPHSALNDWTPNEFRMLWEKAKPALSSPAGMLA